MKFVRYSMKPKVYKLRIILPIEQIKTIHAFQTLFLFETICELQ